MYTYSRANLLIKDNKDMIYMYIYNNNDKECS